MLWCQVSKHFLEIYIFFFLNNFTAIENFGRLHTYNFITISQLQCCGYNKPTDWLLSTWYANNVANDRREVLVPLTCCVGKRPVKINRVPRPGFGEYLLEKSVGPPFFPRKKVFAPLFFSSKNLVAPYFFSKKKSPPP